MFHGGGGNPGGLKRYSRMDDVADENGFLAVYPAGTGRFRGRLLTWNAGDCCGYAGDREVDDVGFVVAMLQDLAARTPVDRTRVFAAGHSNGGMMSYRLAVEIPERLAAVASVAGSMVVIDPRPSRPISIMHIHSVDDPRALYEGGLGPPFPLTTRRVEHPPVMASIEFWVRYNGSDPEPEVGPLLRGEPGSPGEDHTARLYVYRSGREGSEVAHWKLTGAGHGWPGGRSGLPASVIGPPTDIIDASREIWRFFSRFRRPDAPPLQREGTGGSESR